MTQTLGTNSNNDIYLAPNGNISVLSGQNAVEAACATASKASLGEEIFTINSGIPFFQAVWIGNPNIAIFENYLRSTLTAVNGVVAVKSLTTTVAKNTLNYSATIESQYGNEATISGEFPLNV